MSTQAITLVQTFGISKSQVEAGAEAIAEVIREGEHDPLLILANLKAMETLIASVKKKVADIIDDSINDYSEKSFVKHGVTFTKTVRKAYDYTNNPAWVEVAEEKKRLEALIKVIQDPISDSVSGEVLVPPAFKTSESVSIRLAK